MFVNFLDQATEFEEDIRYAAKLEWSDKWNNFFAAHHFEEQKLPFKPSDNGQGRDEIYDSIAMQFNDKYYVDEAM